MQNRESLATADLSAVFETAPSTALPANPQPESNRRQALESLYIANYSNLRDIAGSDRNLFIGDIENLSQSIADRLDNYDGPADDSAAFLQWAESLLQPAVATLSTFYQMREEHSRIVYSGIWSILKSCPDLGADEHAAEEIAQTTWIKVLADLPAWLTPGTAKVSTRLRAFAHDQAMGWRTSRLRHRERFADHPELQEIAK